MQLALTVLEISAPVFILAAVGFTWIKMGYEYRMEFVTRVTMTLSVPCLIFTALMKTEVDATALATVSLAALTAYGLVTLAMWALVTAGRLDRRTFLAPLIFGNTGNLGLPLALFAFGDVGLGYAVVVFAVMAILSFTFGIWLVSSGGSLFKVLQEPVVFATLAGALFLWQGWETPTFLTNALDLIGQIAIPMMLITLGVAIARLNAGALGLSVLLSALKMVLCVASALVAGLWFGLDPIPLAVLIVQVATPVAVTSYLLAAKYGADSDAVAGLVVVSTCMSVIGLPLILAFVI